jgi:bifunctional ADP-heptose synthase (sugar kinase/adenylyltransferase)
LNTRDKILTPEQAIECAKTAAPNLVIGRFDVLRSSTVARLTALARPNTRLFAIVLNDPSALLTLRARAELAAALRVIDYVIPVEDTRADLIDAMTPGEVFDETNAHLRATHELIDHVRERHKEPRH